MKRKKHVTAILFVVLAGIILYWFAQGGSKGFAEDGGDQEKSRTKEKGDAAIADTKKKGFDGVDFSYDVFGAPPGQDPRETARKVMEKDIAEKPKVMARQKQLLQDRYAMDCKTASGVTMTKGKPQPIGPAVKLKTGLSWEPLARWMRTRSRARRPFPQGLTVCLMSNMKWEGRSFRRSSSNSSPVSNASMWTLIFLTAFFRNFRLRSS